MISQAITCNYHRRFCCLKFEVNSSGPTFSHKFKKKFHSLFPNENSTIIDPRRHKVQNFYHYENFEQLHLQQPKMSHESFIRIFQMLIPYQYSKNLHKVLKPKRGLREVLIKLRQPNRSQISWCELYKNVTSYKYKETLIAA